VLQRVLQRVKLKNTRVGGRADIEA